MLPEDPHKNEREAGNVDEWGKTLALRLDSIDIIISLHDRGLLRNPGKIARSGVHKLVGMNGANRQSLKIVASVLQEFGYIRDAGEWLGNASKKHKCPHCGH